MLRLNSLKEKSRKLRRETYALYLAARHPEVPWYAKVIVLITVAYALSPIDLIPDFIPVLGYLDDLVLVPAGIALAVKFIPKRVMDECRASAEVAFKDKKPVSIAKNQKAWSYNVGRLKPDTYLVEVKTSDTTYWTKFKIGE